MIIIPTRSLWLALSGFLSLLACSTNTSYCYDEHDALFLKYSSLGRDLSLREIALIRHDSRSCSIVERRHVSHSVINALGRILVHSTSAPQFQDRCLELLFKRIGIDVSAEGYAELRDAIAIRHHQKQVYGTFAVKKHGRVTYAVDELSVDRARSVAGLAPLQERIGSLNLGLNSGSIPLLWRHELALVPAHYPTKPGLRTQLMELVKEDQFVRSDDWHRVHPSKAQTDAIRLVDAKNLRIIRAIFAKFGFPSADEVARNGVVAFFLLVQHAARDVKFMNRAFRAARPLYLKGDLPPVFFALLTDRVRILNGEAQIYGTQSGVDGEGSFVYPIEDPADVDNRRAKMLMSPLPAKMLTIERRWPSK